MRHPSQELQARPRRRLLTEWWKRRNERIDPRRAVGVEGERVAARHLKKLGYRIVMRNLRLRSGEIDLLAIDRDCLVIVEVKSVSGERALSPTLNITATKKRKLVKLAAELRLKRRWRDIPIRFDVVAVRFVGDETQITVYPRAFDAHGAGV